MEGELHREHLLWSGTHPVHMWICCSCHHKSKCRPRFRDVDHYTDRVPPPYVPPPTTAFHTVQTPKAVQIPLNNLPRDRAEGFVLPWESELCGKQLWEEVPRPRPALQVLRNFGAGNPSPPPQWTTSSTPFPRPSTLTLDQQQASFLCELQLELL